MILLTKKAAAEQLSIHPRTLQQLIDSGKLPVVKVTDTKKGQRIHPDDLEHYIQGNRWQSAKTKTAQAGQPMLHAEKLRQELDALLAPKRRQSRSKQKSKLKSKNRPSLKIVSNPPSSAS